MKRAIFTSFCLAVLFTSCKKEAVPPEELQQKNQPTPFASTWQTAGAWQNKSSDGMPVYSIQQPAPQVTPGIMSTGAVIVYTRGYNFGDRSNMPPMRVPFLFYGGTEQQTVPYTWETAPAIGSVNLTLRMTQPMETLFLQGQGDVEMQYFVLPKDFLVEKGLSPISASKLSYKELSELVASVN